MVEVFDVPDDKDDEGPFRWPFTMVFKRDGAPEKHDFTAAIQFGSKDLLSFNAMRARVRGGSDTIAMFSRMNAVIRRSLDDTDGTPANWAPTITDGQFTDPDGNTAPSDAVSEFLAFEAGSSRRRWMELLEDDDTAIHPEQITRLFTRIAEVAAERPTGRSAPSPD